MQILLKMKWVLQKDYCFLTKTLESRGLPEHPPFSALYITQDGGVTFKKG